MDLYHIALFLHLVALVVAASATAITKLAASRRARARTIGEALDWHSVLTSTAKLFPMCLAAFVVTGAYMLSITQLHVWSTGFVVAGMVGVILLLVNGVFLATKGKALKQVLETIAKNGVDQSAPKLVPPPLVVALPVINTGIAISVVFDMVLKPTSIPVALGIIAIGIAIGALSGMRRPVPVARPMGAA